MEIPNQPLPTRIRLISTLSKGERNLSDLSRIVARDKTTVLEHLEKLVSLGLVGRKEEAGRKWVFYYLTENGREKYSTNSLVYASLFLSALGAGILGYNYVFPKGPLPYGTTPFQEAAPLMSAKSAVDSSSAGALSRAVPSAGTGDLEFLLPILGLVLIGASIVVYSLAGRKRRALERILSDE